MNKHLLDELKKAHGIPLDKTLAYGMGCYPNDLSGIRNERSKIGPVLILRIHERFGMPVSEIRSLIKKEENETD